MHMIVLLVGGAGGCSADDSQPQRKQKSPRQPACPQRPPIPTSILNFIGSLNVQLFCQLYTCVVVSECHFSISDYLTPDTSDLFDHFNYPDHPITLIKVFKN